jgi:hypothetical protein
MVAPTCELRPACLHITVLIDLQQYCIHCSFEQVGGTRFRFVQAGLGALPRRLPYNLWRVMKRKAVHKDLIASLFVE